MYDWPHGLMFHRFRAPGAPPPGQGAVSAVEFDAMLRDVGLDRILGASEWLARVKAGTLAPRDVCLTFDDGLLSQYEIAVPVLRRHGLTAFWFVFSAVFTGAADRNEIASYLASAVFPSFEAFAARFEQHASLAVSTLDPAAFAAYATRFKVSFPLYSDTDVRFRYIRNTLLTRDEFATIVDRMVEEAGLTVETVARRLWMTADQVRSLHQEGHVIGLHSHTHPFTLASLPRADQVREYRSNFDYLERLTGTAPESMSHPLNSYAEQTLAILRGLGIRCGFRSNMEVPDGASRINPSDLEFSRLDSGELVKRVRGPARAGAAAS
jgi:peptidoglycan/xylan/chitin deacetylase (PgdA/CDA1 family)